MCKWDRSGSNFQLWSQRWNGIETKNGMRTRARARTSQKKLFLSKLKKLKKSRKKRRQRRKRGADLSINDFVPRKAKKSLRVQILVEKVSKEKKEAKKKKTEKHLLHNLISALPPSSELSSTFPNALLFSSYCGWLLDCIRYFFYFISPKILVRHRACVITCFATVYKANAQNYI